MRKKGSRSSKEQKFATAYRVALGILGALGLIIYGLSAVLAVVVNVIISPATVNLAAVGMSAEAAWALAELALRFVMIIFGVAANIYFIFAARGLSRQDEQRQKRTLVTVFVMLIVLVGWSIIVKVWAEVVVTAVAAGATGVRLSFRE